MTEVQFQAVVETDQIIRPPAGVSLPQGVVEVTVRPVAGPNQGIAGLASTREWLLEFAAEGERAGLGLPVDLAEHHDHYAHGTPLP